MFRPVLVAGAWVVATYAAAVQQQNANSFCSGVNKIVTALQQQKPASSFCSSQLSLPTRTSTTTVTTTQSSSTTVFPTVTTTITPTVTTVSTSLATSTTQTTIYGSTSTVTSQSTTFVSTSTVYTSTVTSLATSVTTTTSTSTVSSVSTADLSFCTAPAFKRKRDAGKGTLRDKRSVPKPACFGSYNIPSAISSACSCLSIPNPTSTRTVTSTTARISTISSARTTTQTSAVTVALTSTSTTTITSTISATQTTTVFQTVSATATTQMVTTTTSTTTSTSTEVATQTSTVQRYTNFALQASFNSQYGSIHDSVGGSGEGVYFDQPDPNTAATFAFQGTKLYYGDQYVKTYQASSGSYYVVVERPAVTYGFNTDCTLNMPSFSGDGCVLDCQVNDSNGVPAGGNDVDNYGGAWGFQGDTDRFSVYAVGQTA